MSLVEYSINVIFLGKFGNFSIFNLAQWGPGRKKGSTRPPADVGYVCLKAPASTIIILIHYQVLINL